jgi:hypothetical protein
MKTSNRERCTFVLKLNPIEFGIIAFFSNFYTLVILLQVNPASDDEFEIVYKGFYKTKVTFIFAQSLIFGVGHYHWLCGLIRQLPPNSKFAPFDTS